MPKLIVSPGDRYGRLVVLCEVCSVTKRRKFECRCDCGSTVIVQLSNIRCGITKSCGCLQRERTAETHEKHRQSQTTEHRIYQHMLDRCHNPICKGYPSWGGRGITVCDEWRRDYFAFLAHVGKRPAPGYQIEREDNNRGYEPGNVKWATRREQCRNTRRTVWIEYNGQQRKLIEVCEELKFSYGTASMRRLRGRSDSELFIPYK